MAAVFRAGCKTASHGAFNVFQTTSMSEGNDIDRDDFLRGLEALLQVPRDLIVRFLSSAYARAFAIANKISNDAS
jgi:hypothetical protein